MQQKIKTKAKAKADDMDVKIGKTIRKIRVLKGATQQDLAGKIDVTFQQLQKYENGKNRISTSRLYTMLRELNIKTGDFFELLEDELDENQKNPYSESLFDKQTMELISLFNNIKNPKLKNTLIRFIKDCSNDLN